LRAWISVAGLETGPLFRSVDRVGRIGAGRLTARIVAERVTKKMAQRVGLDPRELAAIRSEVVSRPRLRARAAPNRRS